MTQALCQACPSAIVSDLKRYVYADINGNPRPQGTGSDLGAYQH